MAVSSEATTDVGGKPHKPARRITQELIVWLASIAFSQYREKEVR
jgi:hypothetical protein